MDECEVKRLRRINKASNGSLWKGLVWFCRRQHIGSPESRVRRVNNVNQGIAKRSTIFFLERKLYCHNKYDWAGQMGKEELRAFFNITLALVRQGTDLPKGRNGNWYFICCEIIRCWQCNRSRSSWCNIPSLPICSYSCRCKQLNQSKLLSNLAISYRNGCPRKQSRQWI